MLFRSAIELAEQIDEHLLHQILPLGISAEEVREAPVDGGGVKLVRAAWSNLIGLNTVTDNNEGASDRFHFFGIELGAAKADAPSAELDFAPSRGNIVFGNTVRGNHYAGLFFGEGSTQNDAFDNTIFGARAWAIEQPLPQANATLNNLTNLPSRHIGAGLDARLLELSKGQVQ